MPLPFRNPVNTEDSPDDQQWTPPSYAGKAIEDSSNGEWKPPNYAGKPIEEEKKPSVFSKAYEAIVHPKPIHPNPETLPKIKEAAQRFLTGTSPEFEASLKKEGLNPQVSGEGLSEVPGAKTLAEKVKSAGINTGNYWGGVAGSVGSDIISMLSSGFDPRTAGTRIPEAAASAVESQIKQPRGSTLAGKLLETTPQQDAVAIAQTRDNIPRTPANISTETGIPKPSVRRTIGELKKKTQITPEAPTNIADYIKANPDAKMADVEKFVNSVKTAEAPTETPPIRQVSSDISQQAADSRAEDLSKIRGTAADIPQNGVAQKLEAERQAVTQASSDKPNWNVFDKKVEAQTGTWKPPEYAGKPIEESQPAATEQSPPQPRGFDKAQSFLQGHEDAALARIKARGTFSGGRLLSGLPVDDLADFAIIGSTKIARGLVSSAEWSAEMISNFGESIRPYLKEIFAASKAKHDEFVGGAARKLFNSMVEAKGLTAEQQVINKAERAKRFSEFARVKEEGVAGAAKSLSKLKGEYEKVNPGEGMDMNLDESNMLFTAIKRSKLDVPEQARAHQALFTLFNGDRVPQPNELKLLDQVFGKQMSKVSGPGASGGYDINSDGTSKILSDNSTSEMKSSEAAPDSFEAAGEKLNKKPNDFLTKLANFSTKTTRTLFGAHIPGTAISFHGFNEAVRNTAFGGFNPIDTAGRAFDAAHYLVRPGAAQAFLDVHAEDLGKAIEEGGLRTATGDIGLTPMFKGSNLVTKGINFLTNPKPLFGQVIPALKLKGYQGLLEQYEKSGMSHIESAKAAGEATNNIFGGLNLKELERNPTTQKLARAFLLAPDWLESNMRLGRGMASAVRHPMSPQYKIYMTGAANFLGSYIAMNTLNAINNDGKFSFQNDVGHELDVAYGKDSSGRTRYFSPYGTAMDMVRIPLEIAHAAMEGNMGKGFSDLRSRASGWMQFLTDMMTNTDYAGRSLYDKTKFGKPIPPLEQGANIAGDAAGHFLPVGVESGVNLSQGKISPEQFAAQVLQAPMKYKMPYNQGGLRLRKMNKLKLP